jgi:hypothetical protein
MKTTCTSTLRRGLAVTAITISMASLNGFALTNATPTNQPAAGASSMVPAARMTEPSAARGVSTAAPGVPAEDIRDIRGPKPIPSPWLWPLWLAGGGALAALVYAGWLWNRRRALASALLPYEIALAGLEEARALMRPQTAREFSIAVSEIVRNYIEERFQVWAARRTTEEFLHDLIEASDSLLTSHRASLAEFLRHCDLAKFARWILSIDEMDTMLQSAHNFVLETGRPSTTEAAFAASRPVPDAARTLSEPVHATP